MNRLHPINIRTLAVQLLTLFALALALPVNAAAPSESEERRVELSWPERIAISTMQRSPEAWAMREHKNLSQPEWGYTYGLILMAFERLYQRTGKPEYLDYAKTYVDQLIDVDGQIKDYILWEYNIDSINAGKLLFFLYQKFDDERYLKAMRTLREQLRWHPRTHAGGFWHKRIYPWQIWLDGLYMGATYWAQYAATFDEPLASFDDIANQFKLIERKTRDGKTGLLYHAWDESKKQHWADPKTGLSPHFWSRAMGWYAMALVDTLEYMPRAHPDRDELIAIFNRLVTALQPYQDSTGLWYQVVDQGQREGNYLEASGSAMFAYSIARGVKRGYLGQDFLPMAERAYQGLVDNLVKVDADDGEVHLTNICGSAGLGGDPYRPGTYEYYISEPRRDNDPHGVGPFILAGLELEELE